MHDECSQWFSEAQHDLLISWVFGSINSQGMVYICLYSNEKTVLFQTLSSSTNSPSHPSYTLVTKREKNCTSTVRTQCGIMVCESVKGEMKEASVKRQRERKEE